MADIKGKGKARLDPIDMSSDDEDEDPLAMFTMKTSLKGLGRTDDERNEVIISDHSVDEDDEGEAGSKARRKKKRSVKKPPPSTMPEWTRSTSGGNGRRPHKRSSTESRRSGERSELIVISSDDENHHKRSKAKGKGPEPDKSRITLTPPPALSKEEEERERAKFLAHVKQQSALEPVLLEDDDDPVITRAITTSAKSGGPVIKVLVTMMTDKTKLPADASARAIKEWEKRRNITIYQNAKIADLFNAVATSVQRNPDDIVLIYDDQLIKNRLMSAKQLLINDGSYLIGYEKDHWERIAKAKQDELDSLLYGQTRLPTPPADTSLNPASPEPVQKIKICLQGAWGSTRIAVVPEITGLALAELYCEKNQKDMKISRTLKLYFDGDLIGVEATAEEIDLDDGDLIDVTIPEAYRD